MRRHKALAVSFLALAVPVGTASVAYSCTALATMTVSGAASPGATVSGTGKGFDGGGHGEVAGTTPVVFKLDSRTGATLGSAVPDSTGRITFSFTVPSVGAGQHVLIGVQNNPATGAPYYGTPARQTMVVLAAGARSAATSDVAAPAAAVDTAAPVAAAAPAAQPAVPAAATAAVAAPVAGQVGGVSAAPVPAGQAAGSVAPQVATSGGAAPAVAADLGVTSAVPAAAAAGATVVTATPGLISTSAPAHRSVLPAVLLMVLGLGLGLAASARWMSGRLPQLRSHTASA